MTGTQLQESVVGEAHLYGLRVAHFRPARTEKGWRTAVAYDAQGWPDLTIVGAGVIYREIKRDDEDLTDEQTAWLQRLVAADQDAKVWRPADRRSGLITRELLALRRPKGPTS